MPLSQSPSDSEHQLFSHEFGGDPGRLVEETSSLSSRASALGAALGLRLEESFGSAGAIGLLPNDPILHTGLELWSDVF